MIRIAAIAACLMLLAVQAVAECAPDRVDLRQDGTKVRFTVELAITPEEQRQGLMFRESMPMLSGMLFLYDQPQPVAFWMKNTLIPLDMLFIDQHGVVQKIAENTTPRSTEGIFGGDNIQAVLEINGGLSAELGLGPGAELRHPALDQSLTNWSCETE